jgi:hypothetical protein
MIARQFDIPLTITQISVFVSLSISLAVMNLIFNNPIVIIVFLLSLLPNILLACNLLSRILYWTPLADNDVIYYTIAIYRYNAILFWSVVNYVIIRSKVSNTFSSRLFKSIVIMSIIIYIKKIILLSITYTTVWKSYITKISESIVTTHLILKFVHFIQKYNPLFDLQKIDRKRQSVYHNLIVPDEASVNIQKYKSADVIQLIKTESVSLKLIHESLEIPDFSETDCKNIYDNMITTLSGHGITKFDSNAFHFIFSADLKMTTLCEFVFEHASIITYAQFKTVYEQSIREKSSIKQTLTNYGRMIATLDSFLNVIVIVISIFVLLILFGVDLKHNINLILSIFAATSFMISSSLSRFFEGLIFLFTVRVFDLNDVIFVRDESGTENQYTVTNIDMLMTTLKRHSDNMVVTISNFRLKDSVIVNQSRSDDLIEKIN